VGIVGGRADDVGFRLLEDGGWVDPALEPAVEPQPHHPPKPVPVPREQVRQRVQIAGAGQTLEIITLGGIPLHGRAHSILTAPAVLLSTRTAFLSRSIAQLCPEAGARSGVGAGAASQDAS